MDARAVALLFLVEVERAGLFLARLVAAFRPVVRRVDLLLGAAVVAWLFASDVLSAVIILLLRSC